MKQSSYKQAQVLDIIVSSCSVNCPKQTCPLIRPSLTNSNGHPQTPLPYHAYSNRIIELLVWKNDFLDNDKKRPVSTCKLAYVTWTGCRSGNSTYKSVEHFVLILSETATLSEHLRQVPGHCIAKHSFEFKRPFCVCFSHYIYIYTYFKLNCFYFLHQFLHQAYFEYVSRNFLF